MRITLDEDAFESIVNDFLDVFVEGLSLHRLLTDCFREEFVAIKAARDVDSWHVSMEMHQKLSVQLWIEVASTRLKASVQLDDDVKERIVGDSSQTGCTPYALLTDKFHDALRPESAPVDNLTISMDFYENPGNLLLCLELLVQGVSLLSEKVKIHVGEVKSRSPNSDWGLIRCEDTFSELGRDVLLTDETCRREMIGPGTTIFFMLGEEGVASTMCKASQDAIRMVSDGAGHRERSRTPRR